MKPIKVNFRNDEVQHSNDINKNKPIRIDLKDSLKNKPFEVQQRNKSFEIEIRNLLEDLFNDFF